MDAFERSAEDELGCLGSDSDGEASMMPRRQRRLVIGWSDEEKALVVRECCWPGTRVGEVARRYALSANQVNAWRALARRGKLTSPSSPSTEVEPAAPAARPWPRARPRSSERCRSPGPSPLSPRLRWRRRRVRVRSVRCRSRRAA